MIIGIGTDIIELVRIEKAINNNKNFMKKILTENEIEQLSKKGFKIESIAGRFAVKEAISKAMGTGFRSFSFTDIEVLNDELGKPYVSLNSKLYTSKRLTDETISISISHNKASAIAFAIIEK